MIDPDWRGRDWLEARTGSCDARERKGGDPHWYGELSAAQAEVDYPPKVDGDENRYLSAQSSVGTGALGITIDQGPGKDKGAKLMQKRSCRTIGFWWRSGFSSEVPLSTKFKLPSGMVLSGVSVPQTLAFRAMRIGKVTAILAFPVSAHIARQLALCEANILVIAFA